MPRILTLIPGCQASQYGIWICAPATQVAFGACATSCWGATLSDKAVFQESNPRLGEGASGSRGVIPI